MTKPNLFFFLSDQHRADFLGCAGDRVRTPNLDRLAAGGVRFKSACCAHPLCVPARMSLMTGRSCFHLDIWDNDNELPSQTPTLAHSLGAAGYKTVLVGRMHFVGGDQFHGFEERRVGDLSSGWIGTNRAEHRTRGFFGEREAVDNPGPGVSHDLAFDQAVAAEACRVIRDHEVSGDERPLAMVVGFYSPHDAYRIYRRFWDNYADDLDAPFDPEGDALNGLDAVRYRNNDFESVVQGNAAKARAAYRGKTEFLDQLIGDVLDNIAESPLGENALTVYTSDHGDMLGDHGLWAKNSFREASLRVPLVLSGSALPAGTVVNETVSHLDLTATLLEACGADPLPEADGVSLWSTLTGEGAYPDRAIADLGHIKLGGPGRCVVSRGWKLNLYREHPTELFNLADDPHEETNRAADLACADVVKELTALAEVDGWSTDASSSSMEFSQKNRKLLFDWAKNHRGIHPPQWGLPAPL